MLTLARDPGQSFSVRRDLLTDINGRWHLHAELELIHFQEGSGMQFVGDSMKRFGPGDIVLLGSGLPHCWRFETLGGTPAEPPGEDAPVEAAGGVGEGARGEEAPVKAVRGVKPGVKRDVSVEAGKVVEADVRVVHFGEHFCGKDFLDLPEAAPVRALIERAKRGLQIEGVTAKKVASLLQKLLTAEGMQRLLLLQEALYVIAMSSQVTVLSSLGFGQQRQEADHDRLEPVYAYSLQHFRRPILLEEIAGVANISPSAFCRYFKSRTSKTYSRFLIGIRVGHACKLLIENNLSLKQICYSSGFNNSASFYKYFKLITGKSPLEYQKEFMSAVPGPEVTYLKRSKSIGML